MENKKLVFEPINDWQSQKLECHNCGETRSVKYILTESNQPLCNKCALTFLPKSIDEIIRDWKKESGCTYPIQYNRNYQNHELTICVATPGYLIGKAGCLVNKYETILKKEQGIERVKFIEVAYDML